MNKETLLHVLEVAIESAAKVPKQDTSNMLPDEVAEIFRIHRLAEPVIAPLSERQEFADGHGYMINQLNGYCGFDPRFVAPKLVEKALAAHSAEVAIEWLEKVVGTKKASGYSVSALWGIEVREVIAFTDSVSLMPLSSLPESKHKQRILGSEEHIDKLPWETHSLLGKPEAALVVKSVVEPFIYNLKDGMPPEQKEQLKDFYLLDDVRLALTCIGPCAPMQALHWHHFDDPDLEDAKLGLSHHSHNLEIKPMYLEKFEPVDRESAMQMVQSYLALDTKVKKRVRIALERLNQAMRRRHPGDKAMELSIALETLLADGGTENTYKIGLRAALLIGGSKEQRLRTRAIVGGAYVMRSQIVHSGEVSENIKVQKLGTINAVELSKEAAVICAEVIRKIIRLQSIPDWFAFELGAENALPAMQLEQVCANG